MIEWCHLKQILTVVVFPHDDDDDDSDGDGNDVDNGDSNYGPVNVVTTLCKL